MHEFYFTTKKPDRLESIHTKPIQIFATRYKFEIYIYLPLQVHKR